MKNPTALVFALLIFIPISYCSRIVFPNDANLIYQTCKQTPHYNLCVSSLKSNPRSATADVPGLGGILVGIVNAKGKDALSKINLLLKKSPRDQAVKYCARSYHTIVDALVSSASQAFAFGDPKFAESAMSGSADEAERCEQGFSGRSSPLREINQDVHGVAAVAAAIARTLL